jgi:hypothetical protein
MVSRLHEGVTPSTELERLSRCKEGESRGGVISKQSSVITRNPAMACALFCEMAAKGDVLPCEGGGGQDREMQPGFFPSVFFLSGPGASSLWTGGKG